MEGIDFSAVVYQPDRILAVGSFSTVFQCHLNNNSDFIVAVKRINLPVDEPFQTKYIDLLQVHITAILALQHTNVVQHYGFRIIRQPPITEQPGFIIFMEYCQGGTLLQKARKEHPLPLEKIHSWTKSILEGLSYLHEKRIVHRNINASSIFFSGEIIKIGGLATGRQLRENMTRAKEVSHSQKSANHMSPEMILAYTKEEMNIGRATDIWSLGCTVIEMLTGREPQYFINGTGEEIKGSGPVMNFVAHGGKPFYPTETPDKLRDFLEKCFTFYPKNRPRADALLQLPFITETP